MKKIFHVLCLMSIIALGNISLLSAPHPEPDTPDSTQIIVIEE